MDCISFFIIICVYDYTLALSLPRVVMTCGFLDLRHMHGDVQVTFVPAKYC